MTTALVLSKGRGDTDWENASPPLVVTLSEDMCVKAWYVVQGGRGERERERSKPEELI